MGCENKSFAARGAEKKNAPLIDIPIELASGQARVLKEA